MNIPIVNRLVDERFLTHRLRSTSVAGVTSGLLGICLFAWRYYHDHIWSWDLLALTFTFIVVKLTLLAWYRFTD
jgi:hypothetical protein